MVDQRIININDFTARPQPTSSHIPFGTVPVSFIIQYCIAHVMPSLHMPYYCVIFEILSSCLIVPWQEWTNKLIQKMRIYSFAPRRGHPKYFVFCGMPLAKEQTNKHLWVCILICPQKGSSQIFCLLWNPSGAKEQTIEHIFLKV